MEYGKGCCIVGREWYEGFIHLDTKLYLQDFAGREISATFIPVEQIEFMKMRINGLEIRVFPSVVSSFSAVIIIPRKKMKKLAGDISKKVGLKKRPFFNEWRGIPYSR